ncbi:MAG: S-layer homology domain-containing protein, partial [Clostridia bacterium]|nr:S-layer homology domain-containing protein [Clostridia bacterium]
MFKSRLTATILLFAMLLTSVPFCNTVRAESSGDDIAILNAMGISAVESDGYITRGDFTVLIVQAAGIEHKGVSNELFSDISGEQSEYIAAASMFGYVNGMDGDKFCPDDI